MDWAGALLADSDGAGVAAGAVLTTLVGALVAGAVMLMKTRHEQGRESRKDALDEMRQLLTEQRAETASNRERIEEVERLLDVERLHREACERQYERAKARIEYHEELLSAAGVRFRPWTPDDSGTHRPVPPTEGR